MRISDWSSDVCSSDLATHGQLANLLACQRAEEPDTPIAFSEAFLAEQFAGVEDGRYDLGIALGARVTSHMKARPFWHDQLAVIGSASIRKRGCQYVSLSEDHGTLKKTK